MLFISTDKITKLIQRIAVRCYEDKHSLELRIENKIREGVLELHVSRKRQQRQLTLHQSFMNINAAELWKLICVHKSDV